MDDLYSIKDWITQNGVTNQTLLGEAFMGTLAHDSLTCWSDRERSRVCGMTKNTAPALQTLQI
jgi:hypothetical protein